MPRINKSNRVRDPNGHISRVGLRVGDTVSEWPVDGPSWAGVALFVLSSLYDAGVPIGPVYAGDGGRLLVGPRSAWQGQAGRRQWAAGDVDEQSAILLRESEMNASAYLAVIFAVLPAHYTDEDFWIDYEPVYRRPKVRRGSKKYDPDDGGDLNF